MIARLLLSSLLSALLCKVDSELTKNDADETLSKINTCLVNMLTTTTQLHAPFIACLLVRLTLSLTIFTLIDTVDTLLGQLLLFLVQNITLLLHLCGITYWSLYDIHFSRVVFSRFL